MVVMMVVMTMIWVAYKEDILLFFGFLPIVSSKHSRGVVGHCLSLLEGKMSCGERKSSIVLSHHQKATAFDLLLVTPHGLKGSLFATTAAFICLAFQCSS